LKWKKGRGGESEGPVIRVSFGRDGQ